MATHVFVGFSIRSRANLSLVIPNINLYAFTRLYAFTHCKYLNDIHYKSLSLRILIINNSTTTTTATPLIIEAPNFKEN